jgi:hypothetical protein
LKVNSLLKEFSKGILGRDLVVEYMNAIRESVKKFISLSEGRNMYSAAIVIYLISFIF